MEIFSLAPKASSESLHLKKYVDFSLWGKHCSSVDVNKPDRSNFVHILSSTSSIDFCSKSEFQISTREKSFILNFVYCRNCTFFRILADCDLLLVFNKKRHNSLHDAMKYDRSRPFMELDNKNHNTTTISWSIDLWCQSRKGSNY